MIRYFDNQIRKEETHVSWKKSKNAKKSRVKILKIFPCKKNPYMKQTAS